MYTVHKRTRVAPQPPSGRRGLTPVTLNEWLSLAQPGDLAILVGGHADDFITLLTLPETVPMGAVLDRTLVATLQSNELSLASEDRPRWRVAHGQRLGYDLERLWPTADDNALFVGPHSCAEECAHWRTRIADACDFMAGYRPSAAALDAMAAQAAAQTVRQHSAIAPAPIILHDVAGTMAEQLAAEAMIFDYGPPEVDAPSKAVGQVGLGRRLSRLEERGGGIADHQVTLAAAPQDVRRGKDAADAADGSVPTEDALTAHAQFLVDLDDVGLIALHASIPGEIRSQLVAFWQDSLRHLVRQDALLSRLAVARLDILQRPAVRDTLGALA